MTTLGIEYSNWNNFNKLNIKESNKENSNEEASPLRKLNLEARLKVLKVTNRPYLTRYVKAARLKDGKEVVIRPVFPEDAAMMVKFHERLSSESVYFRWFSSLPLEARVAPERLSKECKIDYDKEMVLVADYFNAETKQHEILGIGSLAKAQAVDGAEFAVIVSDDMQGRGLGCMLVSQLIKIGQHRNFKHILGDILPENMDMQRLCRKLGFQLKYSQEDQVMKAALALS